VNVPPITIPNFRPKCSKSIPVFRPNRLKNHTLWGDTYLYTLYGEVPPPPGAFFFRDVICDVVEHEKILSIWAYWLIQWLIIFRFSWKLPITERRYLVSRAEFLHLHALVTCTMARCLDQGECMCDQLAKLTQTGSEWSVPRPTTTLRPSKERVDYNIAEDLLRYWSSFLCLVCLEQSILK